mgnify:FL=1
MSDASYSQAWIGLGANLDIPQDRIRGALHALQSNTQISIEAVSSCYRSAPVGFLEQPDFLNAVVRITTLLSPVRLLDCLQFIEFKGQRERSTRRNGPRRIDLDLLLFDGFQQQSTELTVPHPRMHERRFVLEPLLEIEGDIELPGRGLASKWLVGCAGQAVERLPGTLLD